MPQNSISAQLSNLQQLVADLEAIENGGKKAISNTTTEKLTTISVPQMITSDRTDEAIMLRLNTETSKRLEHHMKRALSL